MSALATTHMIEREVGGVITAVQSSTEIEVVKGDDKRKYCNISSHRFYNFL